MSTALCHLQARCIKSRQNHFKIFQNCVGCGAGIDRAHSDRVRHFDTHAFAPCEELVTTIAVTHARAGGTLQRGGLLLTPAPSHQKGVDLIGREAILGEVHAPVAQALPALLIRKRRRDLVLKARDADDLEFRKSTQSGLVTRAPELR